jgi:small subunit ribosomal protein S1
MVNIPGADESFASLFEQSAGARGRLRRYHTGETVEVTIVAVAREAVFADLGGKQEGMFERNALSDAEGQVRVEVGSRVSAVVDSVDGATGQVRLRPVVVRNPEGDEVSVAPAQGASSAVVVEGARIKGTVTGVERYGVFVQIAGTQGRSGRGLVPTPETGTPRGSDLKKHFALGQEVEAKILSVDAEGKIRLSIAALGADDERGLFEAYKAKGTDGQAAAAERGAAEPTAGRKEKEKPVLRGFGTLADLLPKGAPAPKAVAAPEPKPASSPTPAKRAPATSQRRETKAPRR